MSHTPGSHAGADEIPLPIDPEHDVDGGKTSKYLVYWSLAFIVSIWLSYVAFDWLTQDEALRKVEREPTVGLDKLREAEKDELGALASRPTIDEAIRAYVTKK
jgi:hypothetical protein